MRVDWYCEANDCNYDSIWILLLSWLVLIYIYVVNPLKKELKVDTKLSWWDAPICFVLLIIIYAVMVSIGNFVLLLMPILSFLFLPLMSLIYSFIDKENSKKFKDWVFTKFGYAINFVISYFLFSFLFSL